jgi:uncharacterized protein YbaR (Trm112 family)
LLVPPLPLVVGYHFLFYIIYCYAITLKPWLLNVLACPIDKHHPLEAYFYKWETSDEELDKINREAGKPSQFFSKQYNHLAKQISDGTISFSSIKAIKDQTGAHHTLELQADALKFLDRLEFDAEKTEDNLLGKYPEGIDVLYRYLNLIEVEEGLLRCPACGRWYPIGSSVETIPELMPDDLRDEEKDIEWLNKWIEKIPESVKTEGKPFKP